MLGRLLSDMLAPAKVKAPQPASNPLAEYFFNNPGRLMDKWHHYFEIYHRHFERFRGKSPVVLEIGVFQGGSLQMWREYFGPGSRIIGIDVAPVCKQFEDESTRIFIGDQADRAFLARVREEVPHVDIVIDDGGHTMIQQIASFEELYPHVQANGIYLCEDMHTSLFADYGGGYRREGTFLEYSKALVDRLYGWYTPAGEPDAITVSTHSMHFYDSVLVLEKRPMSPPQRSATGTPSFPT